MKTFILMTRDGSEYLGKLNGLYGTEYFDYPGNTPRIFARKSAAKIVAEARVIDGFAKLYPVRLRPRRK